MQWLDHALYTPRLRLEPVTARLAAAARAGEEAFAHEIGAEAPRDWCATSLGLIARSARASWGEGGAAPIRAVAVHAIDGQVIGDVRFEPTRQQDEIEIGYSVAPSRRRQGYAVEAAGAVIDWLFHEGGAAEIVAGCDRRNFASVRVLRRLGFWLDGTRANAFWWGLTPELRNEALLRF